MPLPVPERGLVLRYAFLWSHEAASSRQERTKDRPCAVVLVRRSETDGAAIISVVPITHAAPRDPHSQTHVPLTAAECQAIGLDTDPHWVVIDEINRFRWPGFDLRQVPGTDRYDYGVLPKSTIDRVVRTILDLDRQRKNDGRPGIRQTNRDDD